MLVTGSFTAAGSSGAFILPPNESALAQLTVAGSETFDGIVVLEVSRSGGIAWEQAYDSAGTAVTADGTSVALEGDGTVYTLLNVTAKRELYRWTCTDPGEADGIAYTITEVAGDVVGVILRDNTGRPLISVRDDGGLYVHQAAVLAGGVTLPSEGVPVTALPEEALRTADVTISAADIIGTSAGQFGHSAGYPLVAAQGADKAVEFVSAIVVNDRATAAYTGGGNVTVNLSGGGAAQSGLVSAANSLGAAADTKHVFYPLTTAAVALVANAGLNLVAASAFTNPGTAAGVLRIRTTYRVHTLGLA